VIALKNKKLVLIFSKDESYLVETSKKNFNTKSGMIKNINKKNPGSKIKTHLGKEFFIIEPTLEDIISKGIRRSAQVITPKDCALILAFTGIRQGSLVVDAGTGTGYLAIFLANYIKPGKVITYEYDNSFARIAKENIELSGLSKFIKVKRKDVSKGIDEKNVDLITLDLKNPQKIINHARKSLKVGGWLVIYSPTVDELLSVTKEIKKKGFSHMKTVENIVREWQTEKTTRPKTMGLMHTGFLTFARKVG